MNGLVSSIVITFFIAFAANVKGQFSGGWLETLPGAPFESPVWDIGEMPWGDPLLEWGSFGGKRNLLGVPGIMEVQQGETPSLKGNEKTSEVKESTTEVQFKAGPKIQECPVNEEREMKQNGSNSWLDGMALIHYELGGGGSPVSLEDLEEALNKRGEGLEGTAMSYFSPDLFYPWNYQRGKRHSSFSNNKNDMEEKKECKSGEYPPSLDLVNQLCGGMKVLEGEESLAPSSSDGPQVSKERGSKFEATKVTPVVPTSSPPTPPRLGIFIGPFPTSYVDYLPTLVARPKPTGLSLVPIGPFGFDKGNRPIFFYAPAIIPSTTESEGHKPLMGTWGTTQASIGIASTPSPKKDNLSPTPVLFHPTQVVPGTTEERLNPFDALMSGLARYVVSLHTTLDPLLLKDQNQSIAGSLGFLDYPSPLSYRGKDFNREPPLVYPSIFGGPSLGMGGLPPPYSPFLSMPSSSFNEINPGLLPPGSPFTSWMKGFPGGRNASLFN